MRLLLDQAIPAHLTLRGDGPDRARVLFTVADLDLRDAVTIGSPAAHDPVAGDLDSVDVVVLPALRDGPWPELAFVAGRGLAVVTADRPGCRAAAAGTRAEFVFPRRPDAIAAAAMRMWDRS